MLIVISLLVSSVMKRKLNHDGQQYHKYQQDQQSPLTTNHWTPKHAMTYGDRNQVPGLRQMWQSLYIYI